MLAFVIPLRHPASAGDWSAVTPRLEETMRSVAACAAGGQAFGVLVANREAQLPPIPAAVTVVRVDYPAPSASVIRGEVEEETRKKIARLDMGWKKAAGAIVARDAGASYIMTADADDLISNRIPEFVAARDGAPGWLVTHGWMLPVGGTFAYLLRDFHEWCGTCLIVRTKLLELPDHVDEIPDDVLRRKFGSHRDLAPELIAQGHDIEALPFPAAVYRTGHAESNYQRGPLLEGPFSPQEFRKKGIRVIKQLRWLRPFGRRRLREFHGGALVE